MKTWTMPHIRIEGFAANEYVAACSIADGMLTIECDSENGSQWTSGGSYRHTSIPDCGETVTMTTSGWANIKDNANVWTDKYGNVLGKVDFEAPDYEQGMETTIYNMHYSKSKKIYYWHVATYNGRQYVVDGNNIHWAYAGKTQNPQS